MASPSSPGPGGLSRGADRSGKRDAGTPGARVLRWDAQGLAAPAVKGGLLGSGRCFRFCFTGEGTEAQRGSACGRRPPGGLAGGAGGEGVARTEPGGHSRGEGAAASLHRRSGDGDGGRRGAAVTAEGHREGREPLRSATNSA